MSEEKQLTLPMHGVADSPPERITNDELYRRSTQFRFWSFTKAQLQDLRTQVNLQGQTKFKKKISKLPEQDELIKQYVTEKFTPISVKEERNIVVYYARKCSDLSNFFKFSTQVRFTAISYLFKFYLVHSIMDYYPQQIMYTCLFLSAKSENNFIGIGNFSKAIPKTTPESILKYEYLILDTLRFSLTCHHPTKPLHGFFLDIQNVLTKLDFSRLGKDYDSAKSIINQGIFTDAQFHYTPPQIALAALYIVDDVVCTRYLMRKFGVKRKQMEALLNGNETEVSTETPEAQPNLENGEGIKDTGNDEEKEEKEKEELTPIQHFERIINIVKECAKVLKEKIDPTIQEAKVISIRTHFCIDPVKYFKKITRDSTPTGKPEGTQLPPKDNPLKREAEIPNLEESDPKRIKTE